ncbi:MAG: polysaccharide biosynthesis/export family protein [Cyanobacteria bacterium P01_D01_bin.105]
MVTKNHYLYTARRITSKQIASRQVGSLVGTLLLGFHLSVAGAHAQNDSSSQPDALSEGLPSEALSSEGLPSLHVNESSDGSAPKDLVAPAISRPTSRSGVIADDAFLEPTVDINRVPRYPRDLIPTDTPIEPSQLSNDFDGYYLGPGDSIFISVQRYPELSFQATLDLQGNVVLPIEGAISLKGLTLAQARRKVLSLYSRYVTFEADSNREISLTLVAQRSVEVTILGAVQRPGFYPLQNPTVATALLTAGGATRTSDLRAIQIQRRIPVGNGSDSGFVEERVNVDLFTPLKEGSALPDVRLEDGDVMLVAELEPDEFGAYDRNLVARSTLAQPIINVRFLNYAGGRGGLGTLNLNNGSTFLDAVSLLGVNPDAANLREVALIRYDPETGRAVTISVDANMAIRGDITQNPTLEDSDVIVVGRNLIGRLSFALQTITRPFRDVGGFLNFFDNLVDDNIFSN